MAGNSNLHMSKAGKTDEFYTQLSTIEEELRHYRKYFKGKTVLCNCDDPYESNFFKYFALNFNTLGLKKLITTCYATSPITYTQLSLFADEEITYPAGEGRKPYKIEISEVTDVNGDATVDLSDVEYLLKNKKNALTLLNEDGDFRSKECIALLNECDIVVTIILTNKLISTLGSLHIILIHFCLITSSSDLPCCQGRSSVHFSLYSMVNQS